MPIYQQPDGSTIPFSGAFRLIPGAEGGEVVDLAGALLPSDGAAAAHAATHATGGSDPVALSAAQLTSGTLPDARFPATLPAASGANLTALNASNIASGSLADARLSANVPLLNAANSFTADQTFTGAAAAAVTMHLAGNNAVGGAGGTLAINFDDGATVAGRIRLTSGSAAGSRALEIRAQADRDGNPLPLNIFVFNAALAAVSALEMPAGAAAGTFIMRGTASSGAESDRLFIDNQANGNGSGSRITFRSNTSGAQENVQLAGLRVDAATGRMIFRVRSASALIEVLRLGGTTGAILTGGVTLTTGTALGEVVMPNAAYLRGLNAAASACLPLIRADANNRTDIGCNSQSLNFSSAATSTTVGAAGAAAAIPTPVGYLKIRIGGTDYQIPYVNV